MGLWIEERNYEMRILINQSIYLRIREGLQVMSLGPSMPNGERITVFMNDSWINLTKLIESLSTNIAEIYK